MLRIFCTFVIIISTSYIGYSASDKLKKRSDTIDKIIHMFEEMSVLIRFKALTVYELADELKQNSMFCSLDFLNLLSRSETQSFSYQFSDAVNRSQCCLNEDDKSLLKSFGNSLGNTDVDGQLSSILVFKSNFEEKGRQAKNEYLKKSRLYRSFGILGGMFISIIVI